MNCPNCGAAMRLDQSKECMVCDFCRTFHFPEPDADGVRVLGAPGGTACPVCGSGLLVASAAARKLLHCPGCRGLLIPMEDFVLIVGELRARQGQADAAPAAAPDPGELDRRLSCPRCGRPMHTHYYAGPGNIVIDNCPDCRVNWLDHKELRRIVRAPDGSSSQDAWILP